MKRLPVWAVIVFCAPVVVPGCGGPAPSDNQTTTTTTVSSGYANCECVPLAPPEGAAITVATVQELTRALDQANAQGNLTVVLQDGTYLLDDMLWVSADGVTFRSASNNRDAVIVRGPGMDSDVSHVFNVAGDDFTVADMTIGWVANHAVQIHGNADADRPLIYNVRFVDTGEQMLKVSFDERIAASSDGGVVECCAFEYSAGIGPQYYIGGIDGHRCRGWTVRNCSFSGIRSPEADLAEFAVHFWSDSEGSLVEHNRITTCDRGIGFGLGDRGHGAGLIRNNMVHTTRDVGIGLENAAGVSVCHNTLYTENYANSIEYRFAGSSDIAIVNNLASAAITGRDSATAELERNVTGAGAELFVDAASGDLHLAGDAPGVVESGVYLPDVAVDIDCDERPAGTAPDIGADER